MIVTDSYLEVKEPKHPVQSLAIWGGGIALIPAITQALELLGVLAPGEGPGIVAAITSLIGGIGAIWGRLRAKKVVKA